MRVITLVVRIMLSMKGLQSYYFSLGDFLYLIINIQFSEEKSIFQIYIHLRNMHGLTFNIEEWETFYSKRKDILTYFHNPSKLLKLTLPFLTIYSESNGQNIILFSKTKHIQMIVSRKQFENLIALEMVINDKISFLESEVYLANIHYSKIINDTALFFFNEESNIKILDYETIYEKIISMRESTQNLMLEILVIYEKELISSILSIFYK